LNVSIRPVSMKDSIRVAGEAKASAMPLQGSYLFVHLSTRSSGVKDCLDRRSTDQLQLPLGGCITIRIDGERSGSRSRQISPGNTASSRR
jgi:hypothetical protein